MDEYLYQQWLDKQRQKKRVESIRAARRAQYKSAENNALHSSKQYKRKYERQQ